MQAAVTFTAYDPTFADVHAVAFAPCNPLFNQSSNDRAAMSASLAFSLPPTAAHADGSPAVRASVAAAVDGVAAVGAGREQGKGLGS